MSTNVSNILFMLSCLNQFFVSDEIRVFMCLSCSMVMYSFSYKFEEKEEFYFKKGRVL